MTSCINEAITVADYSDFQGNMIYDPINHFVITETKDAQEVVQLESTVVTIIAPNPGNGLGAVIYSESAQGVNINLNDSPFIVTAANETGSVELQGISVIAGSQFTDTLTGNNEANFFLSQDGDDTVIAQGGDDTINAGNGNNTYDGGEHSVNGDTLDYSQLKEASTYLTLRLGNTEDTIERWTPVMGGDDTLQGTDTVSNIENYLVLNSNLHNISFSLHTESVDFDLESRPDLVAFSNLVTGSNYNDTLRGDDNHNVLDGGDGDDTFVATQGKDFYEGGEGYDTVDYTEWWEQTPDASSITVDFATNTINKSSTIIESDSLEGIEEVDVGLNNNTTRLDFRNVVGEDITFNLNEAYNGVKYSNFRRIEGSEGNDTIIGNDEINEIRGWGGNDIIFGGGGSDIIYGSAGNDTLDGGAGDDGLDGGAGDDIFIGSTGNDRFFGQGDYDTADYRGLDSGNGYIVIEDGATAEEKIIHKYAADGTSLGTDNLNSIDSILFNNEAPTEIVLSNVLASVPEDQDMTERLKIADIVVVDDPVGTNNLTLHGTHANLFEIEDNVLYLKAGTALDYETVTQLDVRIEVDDPSVGSNPDASVEFSLQINDVYDPVTVADYSTFQGSVIYDPASHVVILQDQSGQVPVPLDAAIETIIGPNPANGLGLVSYLGSSDPVNIDLNDFPFTVDAGNTSGTVELQGFSAAGGSEANDTLTGNNQDNFFFSAGGDDTVYGGGGNDQINSGEGNDTVYGGDGDDTITAGTGNNIYDGGNHDSMDTLDYYDFSNYKFVIKPGESSDTIERWISVPGGNYVLEGTDIVSNIENYVTSNSVFDNTVSFSDSDTGEIFDLSSRLDLNIFLNVTGSQFDDTLTGNNFGNILSGGDGNDILYGKFGNDTLVGGAGDDTLNGGAGDDIFIGGTGSDTIIGGDDDDIFTSNDTADYSNLDGGNGYFIKKAGAQAGESLVEKYAADDTLIGTDTVTGIENFVGNTPIADYSDFTGESLRYSATNHAVNLNGSSILVFDPFISGVIAPKDLNVNSTISLASTTDSVVLDLNDPFVEVSTNNTLGSVKLYGFNSITSSEGNDTLTGNDNANELNGGAGDDTLNGGAGNDIFFFQEGSGVDTIEDWTDGSDQMQLQGFDFNDLNIVQDATSTAISYGNGNIIYLENTLVSEIDQNDFSFIA